MERSINSIRKFIYNGFYVVDLEGYTEYEVVKLIRWTNDPGIGLFLCTDNLERLIPSCQLTHEFLLTQEKQIKLDPFKGKGVFFGTPSIS